MTKYFKYILGFFTFLLIISAAVSVLNFNKSNLLNADVLPLPNLESELVGIVPGGLTASVIADRNGVPVDFTKTDINTVIDIQPGTHYFFTFAKNSLPPPSVVFGSQLLQQEAEFMVYCYSGKEIKNYRDNKTDKELFDGMFWFPRGRRDEFAANAAGFEHMSDLDLAESGLCYLWLSEESAALATENPFKVAFKDSDGDRLNDACEDINGNGMADAGETDFNNPDSDGDGVIDGLENRYRHGVDAGKGVLQLNPLLADTNGDGVTDIDEYFDLREDRYCIKEPLPPYVTEGRTEFENAETDPACPPVMWSVCPDGKCQEIEKSFFCRICDEDTAPEDCPVSSCEYFCAGDCSPNCPELKCRSLHLGCFYKKPVLDKDGCPAECGEVTCE